MKLLRVVGVVLVVAAACSGAGATSGTVVQSPWIDAAERDLAANQALGERLDGRPANARQVAEAQRLVDDGLTRARGVLAKYSDIPLSHHLVGALLCLAYYPVMAERTRTDALSGSLRAQQVTVLVKGTPDRLSRQEGLGELRQALDMAHLGSSYAIEYHLDYAEALLVSARAKEALDELDHAPLARAQAARRAPSASAEPTPAQRLREAQLYARVMRTVNRPTEEAYWWRKVLALRPGDAEARAALMALTAAEQSRMREAARAGTDRPRSAEGARTRPPQPAVRPAQPLGHERRSP